MMMKWFADSQERAQNALQILNALYSSFTDNFTEKPIKDLLLKYINELKTPHIPVPNILNTFNLEAAKCLRENSISLTTEQLSKFKRLRALSNIKYGSSI